MASDGYYILGGVPASMYTDSSNTYSIYSSGNMTGVTYSFGWEFTCNGVTTKKTVASGLNSSSYTWTPTSAEFGPLMANSTNGTLKIVLKTLNGGPYTYTDVCRLTLNKSIKPTISNITMERTDAFNGRSVSNITTHKLSFNVADLYGADQDITVTVGDAKYSVSLHEATNPVSVDIGSFDAGDSDVLSKSISIGIIDSRGRTCTTSTSVAIYKYTPPAITKATVERNADEKPVLTFAYSYQSSVAGATNTLKQFWARCIVDSETYQTDLKGKASPQVLTGTYDITKSYTFLVLIQDSVRPSAIIAKATLPSSKLVLDIGADGKTVTFFGSSPSSATKESLRIGDIASFAGDEIAIGKNSESSVIDFCNGTGTISNVNPNGGYKRLAIESQNSVEIAGKNLVSMNTEVGATVSSFEMGSNGTPWNPNSSGGAWANIHTKQSMTGTTIAKEGNVDISPNNITIVIKENSVEQCGINLYGGTNILDLSGSMIRLYGTVYALNSDIVLNKNKALRVEDGGGVNRSLIALNNSNNIVIAYGGYDMNAGKTLIYGGKGLGFVLKTPNVSWIPYFKPGDSVTLTIETAGYITNSGKNVHFMIPIAKPIVGVSTISVSSVNGLVVRQENKYLYGGSSTVYVKPSSYSVYVVHTHIAINVNAKMANTTNVLTNAPCGVYASIKLTFS